MTIQDFELSVQRTINPALNNEQKFLNAVMGISGESGELIDQVKKFMFQGHILDNHKLLQEGGDICYYLSLFAASKGVTLEHLMELNYNKLQKRYPNGFTIMDSINRRDKI